MNVVDKTEKIGNRLSRIEIELEILGHVLNVSEDQTEVMTELKGENFSDNTNRGIFELMQNLFHTGYDLTFEAINSSIELKTASAYEQGQMKTH